MNKGSVFEIRCAGDDLYPNQRARYLASIQRIQFMFRHSKESARVGIAHDAHLIDFLSAAAEARL
jgi:hypothetical protein